MRYIKNCPKCGNIQEYSRKQNLERAIKNNTLCKKCNNKLVSNAVREKISKKLKGKKKSKKSVEKMKISLKRYWQNKTEKELREWKEIVSKNSTEKWKDPEFREKNCKAIKKSWNKLSEYEREIRFIRQQEGGAGRCKYIDVYGYKVYGHTEERYILSLINVVDELPLKKNRQGIMTPYGMCFPDFEYNDKYDEIKSNYTYNIMIESINDTNSQLKKLYWINNNIKSVRIILEKRRNKFVDVTDETFKLLT